MEPTTIDEAKEILYGHPVDSFVAERNVLVKAIRASGDRPLANEVKTLRKPSAVAALVNLVVRDDPDGVNLILQAAELLRSAQAGALEGSGIDASELQQQYRAAVGALAQSAPDRHAEVRAALEAATIDEASNDDLRRGCLVAVPKPKSIFDDQAPTVSATAPVPPTDGAVTEAASVVPEAPVDELEERRARRCAEKANADPSKVATKQAANTLAAKKEAAEKETAEKARLAEAERERRQAEKDRQKALQKEFKALQKRHREAVRSQLSALDAHEAASEAVDKVDDELVQIDTDIADREAALAEMRTGRERTLADRFAASKAQIDAHDLSQQAQAAVDALAERLAELEDQQ